MDETISKQAAIDAVLSVIPYDEYWREQIEKAVEALPTNAEIIRCRDCVYRELDEDLGGFDWCNAWHEPTREGGFCHLGMKEEAVCSKLLE